MELPYWIKKEIYKNPLFSYDYIGFVFDREQKFKPIKRIFKTYLLEWCFENIAEGNSQLISKAPKNIDTSIIEDFKSFYKDKLFPLYEERKSLFTFHYGKNKAYSDISDVDITSKAFGPNDSFKDDSPSKLDEMYSF